MNRAHIDLRVLQGGGAAVTMEVARLSFVERLGLAAACLRGIATGRFKVEAPHALTHIHSRRGAVRLVEESAAAQ